jgi:ankyrin repeat protein
MNREDLKDRWTEVGGFSKIAFSNNEALKSLVVGSMKGKMYSEVWEDGESPGVANSDLIQAAARGEAAVVEFMIKAGANPNSFTPYCNSALGEAERNGHTEVVELLKKYGATKMDGC